MGIFNILLQLSPALEAGKSLENRETWETVSHANHALLIVLGIVLALVKQFGWDIPISDGELAQLAGALAAIGQTVSLYFHHALHEQNGIKK